ncbi:Ig-like domain repeat protein [Pengzhenrongella phosphoraccumulans]|uniref:Ig-like domain-containing protein n=1 Tax=Pengzhenrongella phosphoraccumulans TaxID=3114394 RepID=UPI00388CFF74
MVNPRSIRPLVALAAAVAVIGGIGVAPAMALAGWGGDDRPTTTTAVFLDSADLEYGTAVTGEVTVATDLESSDGGEGEVPPGLTGQVELSVDGGATVAETFEDGLLRFDLGVQAPGSHTVTAEFPGDDEYASSSDSADFAVAQVPSSLTVTEAPDLTFGTAGSMTVQVNASPEADPTGEVTLTDRGVEIANGTVTVDAGGSGLGTAMLALPATLEPGTHNVVLAYSGDDLVEPSESEPSDVEVDRALASVTVSPEPAELVVGQKQALVVDVGEVAGHVAEGTVRIDTDGADLGTVDLVDGTGSLDLATPLPAGSTALYLSYSGDGFLAAADGSGEVPTRKGQPVVTVTVPASVAHGVQASAQVAVRLPDGDGGSAPVTETPVAFTATRPGVTVDAGSAATDAEGVLTFALPADLAAGDWAISATIEATSETFAASDDTARLTVTATPGATGGTPVTTPVPATPGATGASPVAAPVRAATPARAHGLAGAVLAATGANVQDLVGWAIALLALGGAATVFTRRRAGRSARGSSHRAD